MRRVISCRPTHTNEARLTESNAHKLADYISTPAKMTVTHIALQSLLLDAYIITDTDTLSVSWGAHKGAIYSRIVIFLSWFWCAFGTNFCRGQRPLLS